LSGLCRTDAWDGTEFFDAAHRQSSKPSHSVKEFDRDLDRGRVASSGSEQNREKMGIRKSLRALRKETLARTHGLGPVRDALPRTFRRHDSHQVTKN
jgi:hypothetical protein